MAETKRKKPTGKQRARRRPCKEKSWKQMDDLEERGAFLVYTGPIGGVPSIDEVREDRDRHLMGR